MACCKAILSACQRVKLAAVDIGSNAVRLQFSQVMNHGSSLVFKSLAEIRLPLALGKAVFAQQYIRPAEEEQLKQLLQAFKILKTLYQVDAYRICATASLREAQNNLAVKNRLEAAVGLTIERISGEEEALLINRAIQTHINMDAYLHIDVGGGSTEVSFYATKTHLVTRTFSLGSLKDNTTPVAQQAWVAMKAWIEQYKGFYKGRLLGIATGGNIRKLAQLAKNNGKKPVAIKRLIAVAQVLADHNLTERINKFKIQPERADVILPAAEIYLAALRWAGIKHILAPKLGLKDGIIQALYEAKATD